MNFKTNKKTEQLETGLYSWISSFLFKLSLVFKRIKLYAKKCIKNMIKYLIVCSILLILVSANISSEETGSLPSNPTMSENPLQKPARKPPRFGKRALYLLLSTNPKNHPRDENRQKNRLMNFDRQLESDSPVDMSGRGPNYDNYYRWLVYSNNNR